MRISNLFSFYLTGSLKQYSQSEQADTLLLSNQELDDCEMSKKEFEESETKGFKFQNSTLNLKANLNTVCGQFRFAGMGVINSLFSGVGAYFAKKINLGAGFSLAALSLLASFIKDHPLLSTKFSIFSLGANSIRGSLHFIDSIFSRIGEEGAKYSLPSFLGGGLSIFCLGRAITNNETKSLSLPNDNISGILGRASIHHLDSMLASKTTDFALKNSEASSFFAGLTTSLGFLIPEKLRKHKMSWNNLDGFVAQGSTNILDSLFANIGNTFTSVFNSTGKVLLGSVAFMTSMPFIGKLFDLADYKIPFGTLEGRLVKSILSFPQTVAFNLGNLLGTSKLGIPFVTGLLGLTGFASFTNIGKKVLGNKKIATTLLDGEFKRIPFMHLIYSAVSASAMKLSDNIPAPLLVLFGPMLSFQIGEKFKNVSARFDEVNGLMLRSSIHLWDSLLARAANKTIGRILNSSEDISTSGNILSDSSGTRWLTDDGRIVSDMAIAKQLHTEANSNVFSTIFSLVCGLALPLGFLLGKNLLKKDNNSFIFDKSLFTKSPVQDTSDRVQTTKPKKQNMEEIYQCV
ncbi:MAG: hypothetical protein HYY52_08460 [Candidatus Melainabacteria bacterium]|nr:hypothetical protein [Candidatus Melainabacteria bacterium]